MSEVEEREELGDGEMVLILRAKSLKGLKKSDAFVFSFFVFLSQRTSSLPEEPPVSMSPSAWPIYLSARGGRVEEREETEL